MHFFDKNNFCELIVAIILSLSILLFLIIRGATNIGVILLSLLGLILLIQDLKKNKLNILSGHFLLLSIGFGALFIASLSAQIGSNQFQISSLDGPLRIFLGLFIFILLLRIKLNLIYLLSLIIPISLFFLFIDLTFFDKAFLNNWGGRYASYFVDPNTLGGQCGILTALNFYFLITQFKKKILLDLLRLLGVFSGLALTFYAQSRGGWLSFICIFIFILLIERSIIYKLLKERDLNFFFYTFALLTFCILLYAFNKTQLLARTASIYSEIILWKDGYPNLYEGAVYARLAMWEVGLLLLKEKFFFGFGENHMEFSILKYYESFPPELQEPLNIIVKTGPHSDFLAKALASGILGVFGYFFTILIPLFFFLKFFYCPLQIPRDSARLGTSYIIGIVISGLFNEALSLKYLCSFYGLLLAIFLASIFKNLHSPDSLGSLYRQ
jgi:O-antigen ligase